MTHIRTPTFLTLLTFLVARISCTPLQTRDPVHFDVSQHLGNLSPYFSAPNPRGVESVLPGDCVVDQVVLVSTHSHSLILFNSINSIQRYKLLTHTRPHRMIDAQTRIAPPPPIRTTLHPKPRIQIIKPHHRHPKHKIT